MGSKLIGGLTRAVCILVVIAQCILLDVYLIMYNNQKWYSWIVADVIVVTVFIVALVISFKYIFYPISSKIRSRLVGELPFGYIAWYIYVVFLVAKIAIIFKNIANKLEESYIFGPNSLKASIALSAAIFTLLFYCHSDAPKKSDRSMVINAWSSAIAFDIIDSLEFMEVLFVKQSRILLPFYIENLILAFSLISYFLPIFPLLVLSHTPLGKKPYSIGIRIVHVVLNTLLVNVAFFAIRMYLWHVLISDVSSFVVKNLIVIGIGIREIVHLCEQLKESRKHDGTAASPGDIEIQPMQDNNTDLEMDSIHDEIRFK